MGKLHSGRDKDCSKQRLHGPQVEENQAFITHAKKDKGKGRKFHKHKHQARRPSSSPDRREKKKDLSHIQCHKWKKYGDYANKRKHEASTTDVDEDTPHKKSRNDDRSNDDRSKFFYYSPY